MYIYIVLSINWTSNVNNNSNIYIYLFIQYIWSVFFMNCDNKRKNHGYITSITICILSIMEVYGDIVYIYIYIWSILTTHYCHKLMVYGQYIPNKVEILVYWIFNLSS